MKKNFLISLSLLSLLSLNAFAFDYNSYCASSDNIKGSFLGNVMSLTGANLASRNVAKGQIKKAIKKATGANPKITLTSYFGHNFFDGEFSSLKGSIEEFQYKGMYYSNLKFNSLCPYNKVRYQDNALVFDENFLMDFEAEISQEDLNKYLKSSNYQKTLEKLEKNEIFSKLFKVQESEIKISENKLQFNYKLTPFPNASRHLEFVKSFIKPINLAFGAGLKIENSKIELCDLDFNSSKISYDYILPFLNMTNPTNFEVKIDKNNNAQVEIQDVKIQDKKIILKGILLAQKKD